MNFTDFGMDTASLAGSLEAKLAAVREAGFAQVMISATDVVAHPQGVAAAARAIRASGLRVTGYEALRDFEGLAGHLHDYKIDVAKAMLEVCGEIGSRVLLVEASSSTHSDSARDAIVRDLTKLAVLAIPLAIRIAFKGMPGSRTVRDWLAAWDIVSRADCPNLGFAIDSFDILSEEASAGRLDEVTCDRSTRAALGSCGRSAPPGGRRRALRVFPGEGVLATR
jgi:sugar phosphate isomerase/epimerase